MTPWQNKVVLAVLVTIASMIYLNLVSLCWFAFKFLRESHVCVSCSLLARCKTLTHITWVTIDEFCLINEESRMFLKAYALQVPNLLLQCCQYGLFDPYTHGTDYESENTVKKYTYRAEKSQPQPALVHDLRLCKVTSCVLLFFIRWAG